VIYKLRELLGVDEMGGTMRLGAWPCKLEPGSFAHKAYGKTEISERTAIATNSTGEYEKQLVAAGLKITGRTPDENYVEIVEAPEHPWFLGCQFHPEFKSKPLEPHPLFAAFIGAAIEHKKSLMRPAAQQAAASEKAHAPATDPTRAPVAMRPPRQVLRLRFSCSLRGTIDRAKHLPCDIVNSSMDWQCRKFNWARYASGKYFGCFLVAGPCVIESEAHALKNGRILSPKIRADVGIPYIFKASYDKGETVRP